MQTFRKGNTILESQIPPTQKPPEDVDKTLLAAYSEKFQDLTRWDTCTECIVGCGAAGAVYSLLFMSILLWFQSAIVAIFLAWPFVMILGFLVGALSGSLVSIVVLPVNASLGWPLKSLWLSFVVGGLSGFVPYLLALFDFVLRDQLLYLVMFGSFPAMLLGHLWAYWLTEKVVNDHNARFGVVKHDVAQADVRRSRFGITHIMIFTAWVAVGSAMLSFFTPEARTLLANFYLMSQISAGLVAIIVIRIVSCIGRYRKRNVSASNH